MTILVESDRRLPLVTLTVTFLRGRIDDPPDRVGLGAITARMLRRGHGAVDATAVEHRLDALGAELNTWVGLGITTITVEVLARHAAEATDLVGTLLEEPERSATEWQRLSAQLDAELRRDLDDDALLADRALRRHALGDHPHGRRALVPATVTATSLEAIRACHRERFGRRDTIVGWAGDIGEAHAIDLAERLLDRLPEGVERPYPCGDPPGWSGRRLVFVERPGRSQTQLALATMGTRGDDPDHVALQLAHTAFAGTFTAPLNHAIRTERGLAYDVSSSLLTGRVRELLQIAAGPAAEDGPETLGLAIELLSRWCDEGPSDEELHHARTYLRRRWPFERDTAPKRLAQRLEEIVLGLPAGYHREYLQRLDDVRPADARAAVRRRVDPASLWVAAAGDAREADRLAEAIPGLVERRLTPYDAS